MVSSDDCQLFSDWAAQFRTPKIFTSKIICNLVIIMFWSDLIMEIFLCLVVIDYNMSMAVINIFTLLISTFLLIILGQKLDQWRRFVFILNQFENFKGDGFHSGIKIRSHAKDSIYLISGKGSGYPIQRFDVEGNQVKTSELIGSNSIEESKPVLFQIAPGLCLWYIHSVTMIK